MHSSSASLPKVRRAGLALAACVALAAAPAAAQGVSPSDPVLGDPAADMVADLLIVRPLGLVGTVIGAAGFVLALPFTVPSGSVGDTGQTLVVRPFEYTFNRPLGDFRTCGSDRHACGGGAP